MLPSKNIKEQVQFMINSEGEKTFAILPIEIYEEIFQDFIDTQAIEERKNEKRISLDDFKEELRKNG